MPILLIVAAITAFLLGYGLAGWIFLVLAVIAAVAGGPLL